MKMGIVSRGFFGRRSAADVKLPPGQYLTTDFPVLSAGTTPHTPLDQWSFAIDGEVDQRMCWPWDDFRALPTGEVNTDIHCVTKWSKFDTTWKGVSVDTLLGAVTTSAG